jgi:hypothetical protein
VGRAAPITSDRVVMPSKIAFAKPNSLPDDAAAHG